MQNDLLSSPALPAWRSYEMQELKMCTNNCDTVLIVHETGLAYYSNASCSIMVMDNTNNADVLSAQFLHNDPSVPKIQSAGVAPKNTVLTKSNLVSIQAVKGLLEKVFNEIPAHHQYRYSDLKTRIEEFTDSNESAVGSAPVVYHVSSGFREKIRNIIEGHIRFGYPQLALPKALNKPDLTDKKRGLSESDADLVSGAILETMTYLPNVVDTSKLTLIEPLTSATIFGLTAAYAGVLPKVEKELTYRNIITEDEFFKS